MLNVYLTWGTCSAAWFLGLGTYLFLKSQTALSLVSCTYVYLDILHPPSSPLSLDSLTYSVAEVASSVRPGKGSGTQALFLPPGPGSPGCSHGTAHAGGRAVERRPAAPSAVKVSRVRTRRAPAPLPSHCWLWLT